LNPPVPKDGFPTFNETQKGFIWIVFRSKTDLKDVVQNFTYAPEEFDKLGSWCTLRINFTEPLLISSGDFQDEIDIYM